MLFLVIQEQADDTTVESIWI